ncbi:MAG: bifunctional UDP-N-acetylmuramoyl-tripeptide:D-alanyl-D-alanine ligase/alanine racemase [Saprospiraceae bacterium]|jgi:alanine racemase|nr:bifunctional UDP-N-acetylmuramoyl-tripeptide:D-alanyl-D-alanine ligase/alanine racemase [Saprospiraceae bacterium]MBX7180129.1 bifunctional UDP-N-acetylmuramoyl-tripeptide:D-alanyl-D-alanine ligase/alanine racemase [Saprospiraceae bacterium]MCB0591779.1 bifunctional UDP-N-acetylmuramoyl-tripeptide:D-alanyl-D-alanine ligase/alanine racemase [Saprospiraceae bacterium]MCO5282509.1 bifunctional UDP-N-acetylmuramoyl-tripeptide:D-alanyl-D-alanine ligase/alanine racemase [Saprospiraceae bacterium]M
MLDLTARKICEIVEGTLYGLSERQLIRRISFDTRQIFHAHEVMFIALPGEHRDGHNYIKKAWDAGVRCFLVSRKVDFESFGDSVFILTENTLLGLQAIAAYHRSLFKIPVIGITGSNGKTIVKEWLYQMLSGEINIAKSPKSYNSQLGVPMSVITLRPENELAIFEAGISQKGEMDRLEAIIQPTIGILTYMGAAHSEGFESKTAKIEEKLKLFKHADFVIYQKKDNTHEAIQRVLPETRKFSWGVNVDADVIFIIEKVKTRKTIASVKYLGNIYKIKIPFTDDIYLHNAFTCITYLIHAGYSIELIESMIGKLQPLPMRMELKTGIFNSVLINDTYSSDINSIALAFAAARKEAGKGRMAFIVSDFAYSDNHTHDDYEVLVSLVNEFRPALFIGVGEKVRNIRIKMDPEIRASFFHNTESLLQGMDITQFRDTTVLLKGARRFGFEQIVDRLEQRAHEAALEINLSALEHNLNRYRAKITYPVKLMVMIKASAYGSGSVEVARVLQQQGIDYLAVAYIDEGIYLRKAGISLPIMVMNSGMDFVERMVEYDLEPEIYAPAQLDVLIQYLFSADERLKCHIKLDTGMHRLGFTKDEIPFLIEKLKGNSHLEVVSVFSHLAGSGESLFDEYTHFQAAYFEEMVSSISRGLRTHPLRHILNSSGIARFPQYMYEMVRLGIGLYGFDPSGFVSDLHTVMTLKARISRIKTIPTGSTVGYDRRWKAEKDSIIATISIGYADGLRRSAGNGRWKVLIHGQPATIIGGVCMDMAMVDATHIEGVREGDEVVIFGPTNRADELAKVYETIPYEVFTGISSRVKRTYILE